MKRLIFGCGYVGKPTAKKWLEMGDQVFVVTRTNRRAEEFSRIGFVPILGDVTDPESLQNLPSTETVLVAIGMDRSRYSDIREVYVGGLKRILGSIASTTKHLVYVSSTGVYGDTDGAIVDEDSPTHPTRDGGRACLEAEQTLWASAFGERATVLRLAGIYGPGRIPSLGKVESKSWSELTQEGYLNLIYLDDVVTAIAQASERMPGGVINVSDGNPVLRRDYYQEIAHLLGMEAIPWPPRRDDVSPRRIAGSKRVSNRRMRESLQFEPAFADYRVGLRATISSTRSQ